MITIEEGLARDRENELICEKLLGWVKTQDRAMPDQPALWINATAAIKSELLFSTPTPTFLAWSTAGMILEALHKRGVCFALYGDSDAQVRNAEGELVVKGEWALEIENVCDCFNAPVHPRGPEAIRASAVLYIAYLDGQAQDT